MLHFVDWTDTISAKGNNVAIEISGVEDHELTMRVEVLGTDQWAMDNYVDVFEVTDLGFADLKANAIGFENKDITVFDVFEHLDELDCECVAKKWLADECRDWERLEVLTLHEWCNPLIKTAIDVEYKKSLGTMLEWTTASDEEGFGYLISNSNWHAYCGRYSIHKADGQYIVNVGEDTEWWVNNFVSARWCAEAMLRDWKNHDDYDEDSNTGYASEHRVGCGVNSGNWYHISGEFFSATGTGRIRVYAYCIEGDTTVGEPLFTKNVGSYDDYLEVIDEINDKVSKM